MAYEGGHTETAKLLINKGAAVSKVSVLYVLNYMQVCVCVCVGGGGGGLNELFL